MKKETIQSGVIRAEFEKIVTRFKLDLESVLWKNDGRTKVRWIIQGPEDE